MKKILISSAAIALAMASCTKFPDADSATATLNIDSKVWFDASKVPAGQLPTTFLGSTNTLANIATATGGAVTAFNNNTNNNCGNAYVQPTSDGSGGITLKPTGTPLPLATAAGGAYPVSCTQTSLASVLSPSTNTVVKITGNLVIAANNIGGQTFRFTRIASTDIDGDGSADTTAIGVVIQAGTTPSITISRFMSLSNATSCASGATGGATTCTTNGNAARLVYSNPAAYTGLAGLTSLSAAGTYALDLTFGVQGTVTISINGSVAIDGSTRGKETTGTSATGVTGIGGATDTTNSPTTRVNINGTLSSLGESLSNSKHLVNAIIFTMSGSDTSVAAAQQTVNASYYPSVTNLKVATP